MLAEKMLALRQRHRMRLHHPHLIEARSRRPDQIVHDGNDLLADDVQIAVDQQVERPMHRARQAVLDGRQDIVRQSFENRAKRRLEREPRHERNILAQQLDGRFLAESSALSLERDARFVFDLHTWLGLREFPRGPRPSFELGFKAVSWSFRGPFRIPAAPASAPTDRESTGKFFRWPHHRAARD